MSSRALPELEPICTGMRANDAAVDYCSSDDGDSLQTPLQDIVPAQLPRVADPAKLPFSPTYQDFAPPAMPSSCSAPAALCVTDSGLNLHMPYDAIPSPSSSTLFSPSHSPPTMSSRPSSPVYAHHLSPRFPRNHILDPEFTRWYHLCDELGAGGYGFVMTATHRFGGHEVAVKFIIKDKVPDHAWMEDSRGRALPTEALLLGLLQHPNIVRCHDLFEDDVYFYLVQELHGSPWVAKTKASAPVSPSAISTPALTPSPSISSEMSSTPPPPASPEIVRIASSSSSASLPSSHQPAPKASLHLEPTRPTFTRRPSHDLFECIEQSRHKRLSESQARFVFAQVVDAVAYLDTQGVTHCDIKDENILVDSQLNVKLVDFGSAVVVDPKEPRPYYTVFFGTTAYAASEVLRKKPYRAPPAEVWTLGVLLSYLLTGMSPFPTERDAIAGRIVLHEKDGPGSWVTVEAEDLMFRCLDPNPDERAVIAEIVSHPWLRGAYDLSLRERSLS
ncbi:unnamed protein product [Peniophora sp. CBMAI 1063]|nr:unnamed protein product [Peniophora sp. CBMAI 1063]